VVACSGGPDSQAVLDLLAEAAPQLGANVVGAAHFDHRQRPGSAGEAQRVRELAGRLDVGLQTGEWHDAPAAASEAEAREARYRFLTGVAAAWGATKLATGHTADDQAETVLLALVRGTGPDGLAAMPLQSGALVRPALELRRRDLRRHCEARHIPFVDDPTNDQPSFTRNRIRREVMPALEAVSHDAVAALARAARLAAEERGAAETVDALLWAWAEGAPGGESLSRARLRDLPVALRRRLLRHAAFLQMGRLPGWGAERLEEAARAVDQDGFAGTIELGGNWALRLGAARAMLGCPQED
jgi:tRNA(Ile)-lysidine synthase